MLSRFYHVRVSSDPIRKACQLFVLFHTTLSELSQCPQRRHVPGTAPSPVGRSSARILFKMQSSFPRMNRPFLKQSRLYRVSLQVRGSQCKPHSELRGASLSRL